jgi:rubrerythrin
MDKPYMKNIFLSFANEEKGHRSKLEQVKRGKLMLQDEKNVQDLKISDYLVDVNPFEAELDYQKALIIAMKREKASFKLYNDLFEKTENDNIRRLFYALAQEEARHKLRFEIEYDDYVLTEN